MKVKFVANYTGLSTDVKPTLSSAQAGRTFYETDTGRYYILNSAGAWVAMNPIIMDTILHDDITVNAGLTSDASSTLNFYSKHVEKLMLTVAATFTATHASTTGVKLQLFYSPDGTNWDTEAYFEIEPTFAVGQSESQTCQRSLPVEVMPGYYKTNVVNLDVTNNATGITATAVEAV